MNYALRSHKTEVFFLYLYIMRVFIASWEFFENSLSPHGVNQRPIDVYSGQSIRYFLDDSQFVNGFDKTKKTNKRTWLCDIGAADRTEHINVVS